MVHSRRFCVLVEHAREHEYLPGDCLSMQAEKACILADGRADLCLSESIAISALRLIMSCCWYTGLCQWLNVFLPFNRRLSSVF